MVPIKDELLLEQINYIKLMLNNINKLVQKFVNASVV